MNLLSPSKSSRPAALATLMSITFTVASATSLAQEDSGVLDVPVFIDAPETPIQPAAAPAAAPDALPTLVLSNDELEDIVQDEMNELEQLPLPDVTERAEAGERAAQVVLGNDFAREAAMLGFAPAAANDALSDAARWFSRAAASGFPGAPSLDQAGVRFYPIRVQRNIRR